MSDVRERIARLEATIERIAAALAARDTPEQDTTAEPDTTGWSEATRREYAEWGSRLPPRSKRS